MVPWQSGGALEAHTESVLREGVALLAHSQAGGSKRKISTCDAWDLNLCHCTSLQCTGLPKLGKSYTRMGWSRTGGTPLCAWGEGGRAVPWEQGHCCAGNRVQISEQDRPCFLRWKNILQKRQPHGAQGLGDRPGERAGGGSKALK